MLILNFYFLSLSYTVATTYNDAWWYCIAYILRCLSSIAYFVRLWSATTQFPFLTSSPFKSFVQYVLIVIAACVITKLNNYFWSQYSVYSMWVYVNQVKIPLQLWTKYSHKVTSSIFVHKFMHTVCRMFFFSDISFNVKCEFVFHFCSFISWNANDIEWLYLDWLLTIFRHFTDTTRMALNKRNKKAEQDVN